MHAKITFGVELILGIITFISTMIVGHYLIDFMLGVVTYSSARLFWKYFGLGITTKIDRIKDKFKR
jgi:hypothetical protein